MNRRVDPIGEGKVIGGFEGLLRQFGIDRMCFCRQACIGGCLLKAALVSELFLAEYPVTEIGP